MLRRFCFALLAFLALSLSARAAVAFTPRRGVEDVLAYFDGNLVSINLTLLSEHTWEPLSRHGHLDEFYSGFICFCSFPSDSAGVCACFQETAVLRSLNSGLYRAFSVSVFEDPEGPPAGGYTAFSQIEAAISEGRIRTFRERGVYRLIVDDGKAGSESISPFASERESATDPLAANDTPERPTTWGSVKALFR